MIRHHFYRHKLNVFKIVLHYRLNTTPKLAGEASMICRSCEWMSFLGVASRQSNAINMKIAIRSFIQLKCLRCLCFACAAAQTTNQNAMRRQTPFTYALNDIVFLGNKQSSSVTNAFFNAVTQCILFTCIKTTPLQRKNEKKPPNLQIKQQMHKRRQTNTLERWVAIVQ